MNLLQAVMIVFFYIYFSFFLQNRCKIFYFELKQAVFFWGGGNIMLQKPALK